jgi:hypothetical protein
MKDESSLKRKRKLGRSREERMKGRRAMTERKDLKAKRKRKKKLGQVEDVWMS